MCDSNPHSLLLIKNLLSVATEHYYLVICSTNCNETQNTKLINYYFLSMSLILIAWKITLLMA